MSARETETQRSCGTCARSTHHGTFYTCDTPCNVGDWENWEARVDATAAAQEAPGAAIEPVAIPAQPEAGANERKHSHYFKSVAGLEAVDVYRVLSLFGVTDPCLQHAVKKLLVAGGRGAGKDIERDVQEAMDTLARWVEMRAEDQGRGA